MDMADRRARIETLLEAPLANHAEIRALLLPVGEDGGPKPWLPNLPDATDAWREIWAMVAEKMVEALDSAEREERAHAVSVMAVAPHESSTTRLLAMVQAKDPDNDVLFLALDGLTLGLGLDALPHLEQAIALLGLGGAVRAIKNLGALPPTHANPVLVDLVKDLERPRAVRRRALEVLVDDGRTDALELLMDLEDRVIKGLVSDALRPPPPPPRFIPQPLRFVKPWYVLGDQDHVNVRKVLVAAKTGNERGLGGLLRLAEVPEALSAVLHMLGTVERLTGELREEWTREPDGYAAFVGPEVLSRSLDDFAFLLDGPAPKNGRAALGRLVVSLRQGWKADEAWSSLPAAERVATAEWVAGWRENIPSGLLEILLADPSARVVAAGARIAAEAKPDGAVGALADALRARWEGWDSGLHPAADNVTLDKAHIGTLRLRTALLDPLGWWGRFSYLRFLKRALRDPRVLATCALLDALCAAFGEGPHREVLENALKAPAPAVRIEAILRWQERGLGALPDFLDKDPVSNVRKIYRRFS
jgi:hypothetical protein